MSLRMLRTFWTVILRSTELLKPRRVLKCLIFQSFLWKSYIIFRFS